jgi:C-terminal processing protease CtpA/Prc
MRGEQCLVTERFEHGPAGRAGMAVGDRIVSIDGAMVKDMRPAEVRSHFGSVPAAGLELQVLHSTGTSEAVRLVEGPVYVLDGERALLE